MLFATHNMKHGALAERYLGKPKRVSEAYKETFKTSRKVDILALQEVDIGVIRSRFSNLAALAAKASGMEFEFASTLPYHVGCYGNALLVRGAIEDVEVLELEGGPRFNGVGLGKYRLPPFGYEPRNAILATACIGDQRISVAATHLSTQPEIRWEQFACVVDALAEWDPNMPRALLGDLNMTGDEVAAHPSSKTLVYAHGSPTFQEPNPTRDIDHIAVSDELTIRSVETLHLAFSDHGARLAEVELTSLL